LIRNVNVFQVLGLESVITARKFEGNKKFWVNEGKSVEKSMKVCICMDVSFVSAEYSMYGVY
jgi:hypothetical protein